MVIYLQHNLYPFRRLVLFPTSRSHLENLVEGVGVWAMSAKVEEGEVLESVLQKLDEGRGGEEVEQEEEEVMYMMMLPSH